MSSQQGSSGLAFQTLASMSDSGTSHVGSPHVSRPYSPQSSGRHSVQGEPSIVQAEDAISEATPLNLPPSDSPAWLRSAHLGNASDSEESEPQDPFGLAAQSKLYLGDSMSETSLEQQSPASKHDNGDDRYGGLGLPRLKQTTIPRRIASSIHPSISRLRHQPQSSAPVPAPRHLRTSSTFSQLSETSLASAYASSTSAAFTFHPLRRLSQRHGGFTTMDVNSIIALGTKEGYTAIYSSGQELLALIKSDQAPVSCVTVSLDSSFVAIGHTNGNFYLYDLANATKPARSVLATSRKLVVSGKKEGHTGSPITHLDFVGSRHTSIISGDEHGHVFWWSLGRIVGVESNDVIRMLGNDKKPSILHAATPLPHGNSAVDRFVLSALLTPNKLVIVGLRPPKTWFRVMRDTPTSPAGCAVWCPTELAESAGQRMLAYSWGCSVRLLNIAGKSAPELFDGLRWTSSTPVTSIRWYDQQHLLLVSSDLILLDTCSMSPVESMSVSPMLDLRIRREKLYCLSDDVIVGSLVKWNDRILAHVRQGDFLSAIHLALAYYDGQALGNTIGLPIDPSAYRIIIASRIVELMGASLDWAFSEERMRDDTHFSADGRGVDLTSLFESLANSCIAACIAMKNMDFLYTVVYDHYSMAGIQGIFLKSLEVALFDGRLNVIAPESTKALITMHSDAGEFDLAEKIIWNVDPASLDIDQAITLCEQHGLWEALIHVYNRALHDYVTPLEKLLGSFHIYPYLEHILLGLSYPSGEALPKEAATQAQRSAYSFILSHLVDLDDVEALLHVLDLAFEDPFLDDAEINRQAVVNHLLAWDEHLDRGMIDIFIARNLPKYPQYIFIPPSTLHRILVSLIESDDTSTKFDRQLAVEYLLSAYTPHDPDTIHRMMKLAGFNALLRNIYIAEHNWAKVVDILLIEPSEIFANLNDIQSDLGSFLIPALPVLLTSSLADTAVWLQKHSPALHTSAVEILGPTDQLDYLTTLSGMPDTRLDSKLAIIYVARLVEFRAAGVIPFLESTALDLNELWQVFTARRYSEGEIWVLVRQGNIPAALTVAKDVLREQGGRLLSSTMEDDRQTAMKVISSIIGLSVAICREHASNAKAEDMWYGILGELLDISRSVRRLSDTQNNSIPDELRSLLTGSLTTLVSSRLSFSRLFQRLVERTPHDSRAYSDFQALLDGMLDSYRAETEVLSVTGRLVAADLFIAVEELVRRQKSGWSSRSLNCGICRASISNEDSLRVPATGLANHVKCAP